ncbi:flagellar type III secretion system protein FlhB [Pseudogemmobacter bohemicus]|uniref:flagellar type III secretion system protein FlhB n=1 Tax=Pseudogemmobacter bohemicus TaxID=2250708 RepID=UPI000DD3A4C7|nr:flagellar type III secretion system protein FlhB [Pseudogemmobacter bohemicus]
MSDSDSDKDSRQFDPTPRRLERAREEGDAIRSEDIHAAISGGGLLLAGAIFGTVVLRYTGGVAVTFLDQVDRLPGPGDQGAAAVIGTAALSMAGPILALMLVPAALIVIWLIVSKGFAFAPSKLQMKVSRISIIGNFGQKFGRGGLVDFLKKTVKMVLISLALGFFLYNRADQIIGSTRFEAGQVALLIVELLAAFLVLVVALNTVFGAVDFLWQRMEFLRRNRMTRKELTDEMKESEGDPYLKADRRRRAQEIATRQMLADVPGADVVIVNPTHYAVALKWDRLRGGAPVCVAKGVDEIAARIRERAQEAGVPIRRDPATARAIYGVTEIGQEIRREHYAAVAAAIRFASMMREKVRKRR